MPAESVSRLLHGEVAGRDEGSPENEVVSFVEGGGREVVVVVMDSVPLKAISGRLAPLPYVSYDIIHPLVVETVDWAGGGPVLEVYVPCSLRFPVHYVALI